METRQCADCSKHNKKENVYYLISNFRHVLYVVCFLLGNSPESEFLKFRCRGITQKKTYNNVYYLISNFRHVPYVVCFLLGNSPESEFLKFRRWGITQKKTYNNVYYCQHCDCALCINGCFQADHTRIEY